MVYLVALWILKNSQFDQNKTDKMAIYVAEGYDFNLIIEAHVVDRPKKAKKVSGFWLYFCIRKEQLGQAGDDIIFDELALKDKVAQEWDNLGRKKQLEFKYLAK